MDTRENEDVYFKPFRHIIFFSVRNLRILLYYEHFYPGFR